MLIARFQVDGADPARWSGVDGPGITDDWVGFLTFRKTFTAGITGSATTAFMAAGTQEGSRSYVATEQITGRTDTVARARSPCSTAASSRIRRPGSGTSSRTP